jgi:rubredoxin
MSMTALAQTDTLAYRKWICMVCDLIYDEAAGLPADGLAPGTRMADIPDTWACPDCGVTKADFELYED